MVLRNLVNKNDGVVLKYFNSFSDDSRDTFSAHRIAVLNNWEDKRLRKMEFGGVRKQKPLNRQRPLESTKSFLNVVSDRF